MTAQLLTGANDTTLAFNQSNALSQTGVLPTNRAVGDVLIAFVTTQTALSGAASFQENSGTWTLISPPYVMGSGKRPFGVWIKAIPDAAALSALSAPTFSSTATGRWIVRIARITGADLTSIADGASPAWESGVQTQSATCANATTTRGNSLVFAVAHGVNTAAQLNPTWNTPAGFTATFADNTVASGTASNDSLYVGRQTLVSPGTVTGAVVSTTAAQTTLSAFLVSIKSPLAASPTPHATFFDGTSEKPAHVTVWDGTSEKPVTSMLAYPGDQTITSFMAKRPFYIAHRGGSASYPEETVYAYQQCAAMMMKALEISVWRSSDGVFVCSHDQNLSRVTGQNVDIPTTPWSAMSGLLVNPVGTDNQSQQARPLARIEDVLSRYGLTHVCFVEDKTGNNAAALLDVLDAYGGPTRHVWKAAGPFARQAIVSARGYKAWGYYFLADQPNFASTYARWDWVGLDFNMDDATITSDIALAAGVPAIGHIIADNTQAARMLGLGCIGLMTAAVDVVFPQTVPGPPSSVPVSVKSIGSAKNATSVATLTATTAETVPTAVGDVVLVIHANDYYAAAGMPAPTATGSPTVNAVAAVDAGSANPHCKTWWYTANTAGAQTVSVTETNSSHDEDKLLLVMVLAGLNHTTLLDGAPATAFGTVSPPVNPPIPAPSVSPVKANSYLFCIAQSGYPNIPSVWTPPAGMTKLAEVFQPSAGSQGTSISVAGMQLSAAGPTGVQTFNTTASMGTQQYTTTSFAALTS